MDRLFLGYSARKLQQQTERIEVCLRLLTLDQIWSRGAEAENAVGNLVLHLSGNVRQWILTGVGGEPDTRERDAEFSARGMLTAEVLIAKLLDAVEPAVALIGSLTPASLQRRVQVQNYDTSGLEAIYHVVEHFSYHTGQIVFATKLFTKQDLGFYSHLTGVPHNESTP